MKKFSKDVKKEMKFLTKYFESKKNHFDEVFLYSTYPGISPGTYVISNYGQFIRFKDGKIIKTYVTKDGYIRTGGSGRDSNGKYKRLHLPIHRLVAWQFCDKPDGCNVVNHLDSNRQNNYCKNLEWTTPQGNTLHGIKYGNMVVSGCNAAAAKFPEELVVEICKELEKGLSPLEVYRQYYPESRVNDHFPLYNLIWCLKYDETYLYPVRSRFNIPKTKRYIVYVPWSEEEDIKLRKMIVDGLGDKEIFRNYHFKNMKSKGYRRIQTHMSEIRKELHIPDPDKVKFAKLKEEVFKKVFSGMSNAEIMEYYGGLTYRSKRGRVIGCLMYRARKEMLERQGKKTGST